MSGNPDIPFMSKDGEEFTLEEAAYILRMKARWVHELQAVQRQSFPNRTAEGFVQDWGAYNVPTSLTRSLIRNIPSPEPGARIPVFRSTDTDAWTLEENQAIQDLYKRQKISPEAIHRVHFPLRKIEGSVYNHLRRDIELSGTDPQELSPACHQCKEKRLRCDKLLPCSNCSEAGTACTYPKKDFRLDCIECTTKKQRCNKKRPTCGGCSKTGKDCIYPRPNNTACGECQRRNEECDEKRPTCSGCSRAETACTYTTDAKQTCLLCRRKKVKCDRVRPTCGNCSKAGKACTFSESDAQLEGVRGGEARHQSAVAHLSAEAGSATQHAPESSHQQLLEPREGGGGRGRHAPAHRNPSHASSHLRSQQQERHQYGDLYGADSPLQEQENPLPGVQDHPLPSGEARIPDLHEGSGGLGQHAPSHGHPSHPSSHLPSQQQEHQDYGDIYGDDSPSPPSENSRVNSERASSSPAQAQGNQLTDVQDRPMLGRRGPTFFTPSPDYVGALSRYAPSVPPFESARGGFSHDEATYIQNRFADGQKFEDIREAFPQRKAWELEEDWKIYNQPPDPALRNQVPQYTRMLDLDGLAEAYFIDNNDRKRTVLARVHPRWSDIVVVNDRELISKLNRAEFDRWFPGVRETAPALLNVALASRGRLGAPGSVVRNIFKDAMLGLAIALFGRSLFYCACDHCMQHQPGHELRVFLECRRRVEPTSAGACNECLWTVTPPARANCHFKHSQVLETCKQCQTTGRRCGGVGPCIHCKRLNITCSLDKPKIKKPPPKKYPKISLELLSQEQLHQLPPNPLHPLHRAYLTQNLPAEEPSRSPELQRQQPRRQPQSQSLNRGIFTPIADTRSLIAGHAPPMRRDPPTPTPPYRYISTSSRALPGAQQASNLQQRQPPLVEEVEDLYGADSRPSQGLGGEQGPPEALGSRGSGRGTGRDSGVERGRDNFGGRGQGHSEAFTMGELASALTQTSGISESSIASSSQSTRGGERGRGGQSSRGHQKRTSNVAGHEEAPSKRSRGGRGGGSGKGGGGFSQ